MDDLSEEFGEVMAALLPQIEPVMQASAVALAKAASTFHQTLDADEFGPEQRFELTLAFVGTVSRSNKKE